MRLNFSFIFFILICISAVEIIYPLYSFADSSVFYKISGFVLSQKSSRAIEGVVLTKNGKKIKKRTGSSGYYELNLKSGDYKIIFTKKNFENYEMILRHSDFDVLQRSIVTNVEMVPIEKSLNVKGRVIDRNDGNGVKCEIRINDEIIFSDENGYFECRTYPGDIEIKIFSDSHREFKKKYKYSDFIHCKDGIELFLQKNTLFSFAEGLVLDKNNKMPIYEAIVEIAGKRVMTDNYGRFYIELNESGVKKFICMKEGYATIVKDINLKNGINRIKINLNVKEKSLLQMFKEKYEKEMPY